ncbi:MAG: Crp/Fnr family transcriptional regulator [Candidatus Coatesbacteria bacterium]|mgnify:CR=1 FL=1
MSPAKPNCDSCPVKLHGAFAAVTREDMREMARGRTVNTYKKRSTIFYEGNPSMGLFCVFSGKVKIFKHGADGHLQISRLAKPGDLLGYRALLAGEPYAATAEVIEDATICFLDRALAFKILRQNADLTLGILKRVCQDLRVAERRALDLIQKPVVQRVAGLLLELQRDFGRPTPAGVRLDIDLTREEMAQMAGTTAESLIRTLSDFKQKGLVDLRDHCVFIKSQAGIERLIPLES